MKTNDDKQEMMADMYLSRIAIDVNNRQALRALDSPEILHGMVEACFEGERRRNLWRLDVLNGQMYLLMLSPEKPNLLPLEAQIGLKGCAGESRDYQPLLDRIQPGSIWRFRLTANPTMSIPCPGEERGKVKAITIAAHQREWLIRQAQRHGFLLLQDRFDVVRSEWRIFHNKGRTVSVLSATFEGVLTVDNPKAFVDALLLGIGRGKAYGMGLLTVMSCE